MARKKPKLKKTIAGIKVPKELRKKGAELLETASSPGGRELIATGIVALAGLAAARKSGPLAATIGRQGTAHARTIADAVGDAAGVLMDKLAK
jgi:hypothetical protein